MKVDAPISSDPRLIARQIQSIEEMGYDGARISELQHDPFIALTVAATASTRVDLVTSVVVAFARTPMSLAVQANDIQRLSDNRLVLGIGSQVKPHVEQRFGMPWHKPAPQMREFIAATKAIFDCWYHGSRLDFRGQYYTHTLMPKTFTPPTQDVSAPPIVLSATGPLMTRAAAECADGIIVHPFMTQKYLNEVMLPAIHKGLSKRQTRTDDFVVDYAPMIATGRSEEAIDRAVSSVRERIAFYARTVAYKPVLDIHGWGDLHFELVRLHKEHRQIDAARLITDEVLQTIAIVGEPKDVVDQMKSRFSSVVNRTVFPYDGFSVQELGDLIERLHEEDG